MSLTITRVVGAVRVSLLEMGTLQTILLHDDFDFEVLFKAIRRTGFGIDALARFACTCKLSRAWIRCQLLKCNVEQLSDFLWHMRITGFEGGCIQKRGNAPNGNQLLWVKHSFFSKTPFDGPSHTYCGFFKVLDEHTGRGKWHRNWTSEDSDDVQLEQFERRDYRPMLHGFARYPMFDEQVMAILARRKQITTEDKQLMKQARIEKAK
jgi:hypothetical protein